MDERQRHIFINYDPSDPRPNRTQRKAVSAYIGKHFRNRSAPARRAQQTTNGSENRLLPQSLVPSVEAQGRLVIRGSQFLRSSNEGDRHSIEHNAGPEAPGSPGSNIGNSIILLRPVIECFVPAYPTEHREKVFDVLDFRTFYPVSDVVPRLHVYSTTPVTKNKIGRYPLSCRPFDALGSWCQPIRSLLGANGLW